MRRKHQIKKKKQNQHIGETTSKTKTSLHQFKNQKYIKEGFKCVRFGQCILSFAVFRN